MDLTRAALAAPAFAKKHPYATLAIGCLLALVLFYPGAPRLLTGAGACLLAALGLFAFVNQRARLGRLWRGQPVLVLLGGLAGLLLVAGFFLGKHPAVYLFVLCALAVWLAALCLIDKNALETWHIALFLGFLSCVLHLMFILYAPYYSFQHDLGEPGGATGHLSYIEYLMTHNFALPQFDLREWFGYQNPPLHHLLAALWLKIATALSTDYVACLESLQMLTLFYSGWVTITSYKLLRELGLTKAALLVPFAIICAHPSLVLFAGLLNNDVLCLALMLQAALFALRWYKNPTMAGIVTIALCIGFSMLSKSTGAMVAPGVAFLFLARLLQSKKQWRTLFLQFFVFGVICVPLGLWWNFYYLFTFGTPLFYVPFQGLESNQYVGYYPLWQRLFDMSPFQFKSLYHHWGDPYFEYSIPVVILKTSVFGEFSFAYNRYVGLPSAVLFYSNVALVAASLAAMVHSLFARQGSQSRILRVFLGIFYLSVMGAYVRFSFSFPHSCTMNYRYIVPSFIIGCCFLGFALQRAGQSRGGAARVVRALLYTAAGVFCLSSCLFFMLVAMG